jgi:hypothetical protein
MVWSNHMTVSLIAVGLVWALILTTHAQALEDSIRSEFMVKYQDAPVEERLAAVELLRGAKEKVTRNLLFGVAARDEDKGVRLKAHQILASCEDWDGSVAFALSQSFRSELDYDTILAKAQVAEAMEFKSALVHELVGYLRNQRYPGHWHHRDDDYDHDRDWDWNGRGWGGGGAAGGFRAVHGGNGIESRKIRAHISSLLGVFNKLAGANLRPHTGFYRDVEQYWWANIARLRQQDYSLRVEKADSMRGHAGQPIKAPPARDPVTKPAVPAERPSIKDVE